MNVKLVLGAISWYAGIRCFPHELHSPSAFESTAVGIKGRIIQRDGFGGGIRQNALLLGSNGKCEYWKLEQPVEEYDALRSSTRVIDPVSANQHGQFRGDDEVDELEIGLMPLAKPYSVIGGDRELSVKYCALPKQVLRKNRWY